MKIETVSQINSQFHYVKFSIHIGLEG